MSSASIVQGSPAAPSLLRQGTALISAGDRVTPRVVDAAITADSVVICWGLGARDGDGTTTGARGFCVDTLEPGLGFVIRSQGEAVANKNVGWAVLKY
jgi:hypothetical protein